MRKVRIFVRSRRAQWKVWDIYYHWAFLVNFTMWYWLDSVYELRELDTQDIGSYILGKCVKKKCLKWWHPESKYGGLINQHPHLICDKICPKKVESVSQQSILFYRCHLLTYSLQKYSTDNSIIQPVIFVG